MRTSVKRRAGFTLVELVVVIMIIGILAAIAAPKIFTASKNASDNAARANLRILRDAIDTYSAYNGGSLPGQAGTTAGLQTDLAPYLRGGLIPACPVGTMSGQSTVEIVKAGTTPTADNTTAWIYDNVAGVILINSTATSSTGAVYSSY